MKMFKKYPDVVSVIDLQKMLNIGKNTAYKLVKNGKIQSIRIGKVHKIPKLNVIKYMKKTQ